MGIFSKMCKKVSVPILIRSYNMRLNIMNMKMKIKSRSINLISIDLGLDKVTNTFSIIFFFGMMMFSCFN